MSTNFDKSNYKPGFWALNITQFQGAMSDNIFKWVLIFFLVNTVVDSGGDSAAADVNTIGAKATILFSIPFMIFPGIFGSIADRFTKQRVAHWTKWMEVAIMGIGGVAILSGQTYFVWAIFFLMATQSALFGPAKYGILPEMLPESRLSWGNGVIQMATMVAIIAGVGLAGPLFNYLDERDNVALVSPFLVLLAFVGVVSSRYISKPPAANPSQPITLNPLGGTKLHFQAFRKDRWLLLTVIGYVYFWFLASLLNVNILTFAKVTLELDEIYISAMLSIIAIGIGAGAMTAGYVSRGKIEVGLIPLGAMGMTVFSGLLALDIFTPYTYMALLFGLGFFGGVFDVPLIATLQQRSPESIRGGVMATVNMLTFFGMTTSAGLIWTLGKMNVSPHGVFLFCGITSLIVGLYICILLPVFVLRLFLWLCTNTLYRLRVLGRRNVPEHGGGLLIANHSSFLDALVIIAAIDRPVRFIMYRGIYDIPWVKPIAKLMGAIPVMPGGGPREVVHSLRAATDAINAGELVCVFAEGQITRTGQMLPFRKGFERIMQGVDAPIIPVYIDQLWGSIFSFSEGKVLWKRPTKIPYPIAVAFGEGMPSETNAYELRNAIQELGTEVYQTRKLGAELLHRAFVKVARRYPFKLAIADARSGALSYFKTLVGSVALARKLKDILGPDQMVGVLLPQGVGSALVNIALPMMGKVAVNLNYTASNEALGIAARQCGMTQVITAKAFLEQVPVEVPGEMIHLEDLRKTIEKKDRTRAALQSLFMPIKRLEQSLGAPANRDSSELATVIFSSGSEGEPKGIMLTHFNVLSNVESAIQVFPHKKFDVVMGMLPFFHSFGYTGTLWVVLTQKLSGIYHPNPLEARPIGDLVKKYHAKLLFSTSTFLHNFIRRCSATQLSTLMHIVTGAEKLAPRVRDAFKEKFGVEPLEGYGTTECAPIVSLNVPDFRAPGFFQKGTKRGSIGHPLPGISVRIVDPETHEVFENGEAGLLLVKGPNIMQGYLGKPEKTAEVLKDGWYETGDIATIDEDGFITITDRLARFSKIAGEMVSHTKIEEELQGVLDEVERVLAVAGVPDANKGERLVVLHTLDDEQFDDLISKLGDTGLPNLWIPKQKAFYKIDEIPILGTGKMDLSAVKKLARKLDIGE